MPVAKSNWVHLLAFVTLIFFTSYFSKLGDEIPKEDCQKLLDELCEKEDEDGFIPYKPFVDKLCGK